MQSVRASGNQTLGPVWSGKEGLLPSDSILKAGLLKQLCGHSTPSSPPLKHRSQPAPGSVSHHAGLILAFAPTLSVGPE